MSPPATSIAPLESQLSLITHIVASQFGASQVRNVTLPRAREAFQAPGDESLREAIGEPFGALHAFVSHYAFARRGKDAALLGETSSKLLNSLCSREQFPALLHDLQAKAQIEKLLELNTGRSVKHRETLYTVLTDTWDLCRAEKDLTGDASLGSMVEREVREHGCLEASFDAISSIRGVGPKAASTFLRDILLIVEAERYIAPDQRLYAMPVDRWLRAFVIFCFPEIQEKPLADWIIAGKACKLARLAGVSPILLNLGITAFGRTRVFESERLPECLSHLVLTFKEEPQAI